MKHLAPAPLLIIALASAALAQAQTPSQPTTPPVQQSMLTASSICGGGKTYDQLTADDRKPSPPQIIPYGKSPIALTISDVEYNDTPVDAKTASSPDFCFMHTLWVGVDVSTTGELASFADGEGACRSGGGGKLPPADFARLQSLMANLLDDHHRVPPATRRVTVEVRRDGTATVRLYDSADLPDAIIEMIRITGVRIHVITPVFKPDRGLTPEEIASLHPAAPRREYDFLTVSPDGSTGVVHDFTTKTLTVYKGSQWPEVGLPKGGKIIRVIPEFWQPNVYGGYWVDTEFSPGGRYLLVTWGTIGVLLYDTSTWQPITNPRVFPQHLKEYLHSTDWNWGIAVTDSGETLVWNQQEHRIVSKLPGLGELAPPDFVIRDHQGHQIYTEKHAEIQAAAFSPDHTRVAVFRGPNDASKLRLSIFDLQTGKKLRDLWPAAWSTDLNARLIWWNNGRWLLAPHINQDSNWGTGVWNVETGRFLGNLDLTGCDTRISPVIAATRLLQPCFMGQGKEAKGLEWTVDGVLTQITTRESLVALGKDILQ